MSAAVAVGPLVVEYGEEERGGGLLETGVRMIVLAFFLSPSHLLKCFICMKVLTVERWPGRSADCVDILIFLSGVTGFCLSASRSIDVRALAVLSSVHTVSSASMVGRKNEEG